MSWLKRLFRVFNREEEEPIQKERPLDDEGNRDVDARIFYQYPKGQFRFPLIPDEEIKEPRVRNEKRKIESEQPPQQAERRKSEKRSKNVKTVEMSRVERKKAGSSRPFRPTEIPSPVYGFEQRRAKEEPVEFELADFSQKIDGKQSDAILKSEQDTQKEISVSIEKTHPVEAEEIQGVQEPKIAVVQEPQLELVQELQTEAVREPHTEVAQERYMSEVQESGMKVVREPSLEVVQEQSIETVQEPTMEVAQEQQTEVVQAPSSATSEEPYIEVEPQLEAVHESYTEEVRELHTEVEERYAKEVQEPSMEVVQAPHSEVVQEPHSEVAQELNMEVTQEQQTEVVQAPSVAAVEEPYVEGVEAVQAPHIEVTQEPHPDKVQEPHLEVAHQVPSMDVVEADIVQKLNIDTEDGALPTDVTVETVEQGILPQEQNGLEPSATPDEVKTEEQKRRSHIPFNVIMLKEDKKKWQERIQQKLEDRKATEEVNVIAETIANPLETGEAILEQIDEEDSYYAFPSLDLLKPPVFKNVDVEWLQLQEEQLNETLFNFNVRASVANVTQGPSVTRFEVRPEPGVKVNKITNLTDDIKLSLAAKDIRMEAPIPGTHMIGIEVPNQTSRPVLISEILTSAEFSTSSSPLTAVLGLDIAGKPIVTDLRKMPHGLIAGATGSGKSVCINSILVSLLYKADPNDVKLLLIDPKMVELAPYNGIPHLVSPVITDVKAATAALKWAVDEMERRYELFAHAGVRDIARFNEEAEKERNYSLKLPYIVIVIDELADLMMMSPADVEEAICRIAQKARACGIHLIIATQRPSVDVITGLIKANVPTRIAFSVSSQIDSRTIIDISGAERLLGRGDMLFLENGASKPVRLQGTFVSDEEIDAIVHHVRLERSPEYLFEQEELLKKATVSEEEDELFYEACEFIVEQGGASTSSLQRKFKIGYNRAARLMDMMEEHGFISGQKGSKPREVLINETDLESIGE